MSPHAEHTGHVRDNRSSAVALGRPPDAEGSQHATLTSWISRHRPPHIATVSVSPQTTRHVSGTRHSGRRPVHLASSQCHKHGRATHDPLKHSLPCFSSIPVTPRIRHCRLRRPTGVHCTYNPPSHRPIQPLPTAGPVTPLAVRRQSLTSNNTLPVPTQECPPRPARASLRWAAVRACSAAAESATCSGC